MGGCGLRTDFSGSEGMSFATPEAMVGMMGPVALLSERLDPSAYYLGGVGAF